MKRLIKFDIIHPRAWLEAKKAQLPDLRGMPLAAYREWLLSLGSNYSDFYTHPLNQSGAWAAEEYFLNDPDYTRKVAEWLWGKPMARLRQYAVRAAGRLLRRPGLWQQHVVERYVRLRGADVLFVRSQPLPSGFWQRFRADHLLVARLSARLPANWHPNHWDLLYTDQPDFQRFFELHGVTTLINDQGFDRRIIDRLQPTDTPLGVVFVGGLGMLNFRARTLFFERIAAQFPFRWWGYWFGASQDDERRLADFPHLHRGFQGPTSGVEMYQLYHDADICLNDYVDTSNGIGFNQRMFEVMGAGGFLLTRRAPNFANDFPDDIFATYTDEADCIRQINYYLARPDERQAIARRGQAFVVDNYDYARIGRAFGADLEAHLARRFPERFPTSMPVVAGQSTRI